MPGCPRPPSAFPKYIMLFDFLAKLKMPRKLSVLVLTCK